MVLSGCSLSARATPGRLGRGGFLAGSGRFGFWPFEGGRLELSGVFGGAASLASSSRDARGQRADLLRLRFDLRMLRQDQRDQLITGEGKEACVVHASP